MEVAMCCTWPWEFYVDTPGEKVCAIYGYEGDPAKAHYDSVQRTSYRNEYGGMSFTVTRTVLYPNSHTKPLDNYGVTKAQLKQMLMDGDEDSELIGIAHTHPWKYGSEPSDNDLAYMPAGMLGVVVSGGPVTEESFFIGEGSDLSDVLASNCKSTQQRSKPNEQ